MSPDNSRPHSTRCLLEGALIMFHRYHDEAFKLHACHPFLLYVLTSELLLARVELVLLGVLLERLEVGEHAHEVGEVDDLGAGGKLAVLRGVGRVDAARVGGGGTVPVNSSQN